MAIQNNKTISLLRSLQSKELNRFEQFLTCTFFGYGPDVFRIYQLLIVDYPGFEKGFVKHDLYRSLFPEKEIAFGEREDKKIRYLLNYLNDAIQHFILYEKQFARKPQHQYQLGQAFQERGLTNQVTGLIKSVSKNAQKTSHVDPDYYYEQFRLAEIQFSHSMATQNRGQKNGLQEVMDDLDAFYLATQLRYYCAAVNRENILKLDYKYPMMDALGNHIQQHDFSEEPYILVYFQILQMLKQPDGKKHYLEAKRLISNHQLEFSFEERQQVYWFMINFCSASIKKGDLEFQRERHELYTSTLDDRIWHLGPYLSTSQFILIVQNALAIDQIEWTSQFMEQYIGDVVPRLQKSLNHLGLSYLSFAKGDFESAHNHWIQIESPEDFFFGLYYRVLILKIFFEKSLQQGLENYEMPIINALEALRFYLSPSRNQNMSEGNRKSYSNFVKMTRRLLRIRHSWIDKQPKKSTQRLLKDLKQIPYVEERKWLKAKAESFLLMDPKALKPKTNS